MSMRTELLRLWWVPRSETWLVGRQNESHWRAHRATLVELAELMVQWSCPLVVVAREDGATMGVVSADRLLDLLVSGAEDASS